MRFQLIEPDGTPNTGDSFDHHLLSSTSPLTVSELTAALDGIIKAELVYRRGVPPEAHYLFNHVRDQKADALAIAQSFLTLVESGFDTVAVLMPTAWSVPP